MQSYLPTERSDLTASTFTELKIRIAPARVAAILSDANEAVEAGFADEWRVQDGQKWIRDAGYEIPGFNLLGSKKSISTVGYRG